MESSLYNHAKDESLCYKRKYHKMDWKQSVIILYRLNMKNPIKWAGVIRINKL